MKWLRFRAATENNGNAIPVEVADRRHSTLDIRRR